MNSEVRTRFDLRDLVAASLSDFNFSSTFFCSVSSKVLSISESFSKKKLQPQT
jgi:hypothetical protein